MRTTHSRQAGFTLIEVLIVVGIIGLLAAIAIPNYTSSLVKGRRAQAASCLQEHAQFMERYYTTNLAYDQTAAGVANTLPGLGCTTENRLNTYYTFSLPTLTARTYTVTATPIGSQLTADAVCKALSINQAGARSITGTGSVTNCF